MSGFLLHLPLYGADLVIDHVTVAGTDLKQMRARLGAIGIASEYGGPHNNHATEMALTSFRDGSYLELIALQPNADQTAVAAHYWSPEMKGNAGPTAWAVRTTKITAEVERLRAAGLTVSSPGRSGRARPDGVKLEWEAAPVGSEPNGTFFPFLIQDITPREARSAPSGKPITQNFNGISRVVIAVRDLPTSVARYQRAYGLAAPSEQEDAAFGARLAAFPGIPVILAAPLNPQSWVAKRIQQFGEGPCAFLLGKRGNRTLTHLARGGTRWFGHDVQWFDLGALGWRLGIEK